MLFGKIKKTFHIPMVVLAIDFRPLLITKPPYEEIYPFWQLFYVNRGQMEIERDGVRETVSAGQMILRPPGRRSTMYYPEECELHMGLIDFMCTDEAMHAFPDRPITLEGKEKRIISELLRESSEFFKHAPTEQLWLELVSTALENFLLRLYGRLQGILLPEEKAEKATAQKSISELVDKINVILEERRFSTITIEELSSILNESPNVLMKHYKREMNEGIIEHFLSLKLQTAIQLILAGEMNFTEISELLGFSSVNYFSKFFKSRTGITPTEYSKQGELH